jgi:hypothetical protein
MPLRSNNSGHALAENGLSENNPAVVSLQEEEAGEGLPTDRSQ